MPNQSIEDRLSELYQRYDRRCSKGQLDLAEATLYQIRTLEGQIGKESKPSPEEECGLIPPCS